MHLELPVYIYLPPPGAGPATATVFPTRACLRRATGRPRRQTVDHGETPSVWMIRVQGDGLAVVPLAPPY